jgi:DNA polymerase III delta prime subunit
MNWSGVGHEKQKAYFERLIESSRLGHAYLLAGPEGLGKRMMAEEIASHLLADGTVLDMMRLAPERDEKTGKMHDISIEDTRKLKSWMSLRPTGTTKVAIIDDADLLGGEAANNILKLLEEPPAYAHFFLVSGHPGQVMATVLSRCERIDFHPLSAEQMKRALKGHVVDEDDVELLAAVAAGRPGAAIRLIQDKQLGAVRQSIKDLGTLLKGGIAERIVYAKTLADDEAAQDTVSWWLSYTHSRLAAKPHLAPVVTGLLDLSQALAEPALNRRLAIENFLLSLPRP